MGFLGFGFGVEVLIFCGFDQNLGDQRLNLVILRD
jgi:hypothetical protein